MKLGIFAKTFKRDTLPEVLDAVVASGIQHVQFNFSCAGLDSLPERHDPTLWQHIHECHEARGLKMIAVSGTFNAIHPDQTLRRAMTQRCIRLIEACAAMKVPLLTLCTGTRCAEDMWTGHADNATPAAWADLCHTLEPLIAAAEANHVTLGIEPEHANVISSARLAHRLLDELQSPQLGIVMDGANLIDPHELIAMPRVFNEAFDLLGDRIVSVHAKELSDGTPLAAGTGLLDWSLYFALLHQIGYAGPVVLHNLPETTVGAAKAFIESFGILMLALRDGSECP